MFELGFRVSYKLRVHFVFDMNPLLVLVDDNMNIESMQNETKISFLITVFRSRI